MKRTHTHISDTVPGDMVEQLEKGTVAWPTETESEKIAQSINNVPGVVEDGGKKWKEMTEECNEINEMTNKLINEAMSLKMLEKEEEKEKKKKKREESEDVFVINSMNIMKKTSNESTENVMKRISTSKTRTGEGIQVVRVEQNQVMISTITSQQQQSSSSTSPPSTSTEMRRREEEREMIEAMTLEEMERMTKESSEENGKRKRKMESTEQEMKLAMQNGEEEEVIGGAMCGSNKIVVLHRRISTKVMRLSVFPLVTSSSSSSTSGSEEREGTTTTTTTMRGIVAQSSCEVDGDAIGMTIGEGRSVCGVHTSTGRIVVYDLETSTTSDDEMITTNDDDDDGNN